MQSETFGMLYVVGLFVFTFLIVYITKPRDTTMNEELYHFYLVRHLPCGVESTHMVETTTDDPYRTVDVVRDLFIGWDVIAWASATDREYQDMIEDVQEHWARFEPMEPSIDKPTFDKHTFDTLLDAALDEFKKLNPSENQDEEGYTK